VFTANAPSGDSYQLPLAVGDRLFVQDVTGNLVFALDAASGSVDWQTPLQIGLTGDPAVAIGSTLFVGANADPCAVYAFTESGGHQLWNFQDGQTDKDWYLSTDGTMLFAVHGDKVYGLPPV
jgi:outer membrane protein assembly factor BamB